MFVKKHRHYTHAEYFALEEQAETKSEYHQGEIIAQAGATVNHNRIALNTANAIVNTLTGTPCETFVADLRVWIEKRDRYVYPDVMVICGDPSFVEGRTDTITNPKVIIEVLSESTEHYDRNSKFHAYWTLAGFEEYVLIDQSQMRVEYFRRMSDKEWLLRVLTKPEDILFFESVGVEITLNKIYRNVTWPVDESTASTSD